MSDDDVKPLSVKARRAQKILDVGRTKLKELISEGKLSAVVKGNRIDVIYASIENYHASLPAYVPGSAVELSPRHPVKRKTKRARRLPSSPTEKKSSNLKVAKK